MRNALSLRTQQGAGLIVALVFLAVLTIAGITAARLTNMEERMAGNSQFRGLTYQNAQSEIRSQMAAYNANLLGRKPLLDAANQSADAISGFPDRRRTVAVDAILTNANITTNTIRFMNKGICEGASVGKFECSGYEINSASRLDNGASSNQVQGIYFINSK
ncbi:PilX N-terminal domain-containing pilus assembly protein [Pseudomonas nicosulfuronedens]|jgi:Tfp pilus assembly protein PilX|uniref:Pilus assembly protein PilX n=1 Tax=Pseudomonas nicosulfuronedens TaxID=2571105 RepID=A0A5R9RDW7_9PSED|nr:PilX N-terminal domain-containing pilus assembly protein [Pseudomonas nicosulfuronedens]MDH1007858.1 PilX N-terminal domain-containing pilus assembly protein [Pseudomonas nicosulfuronedens]MDH1978440.1 PilX N-terminal domain-containing pilus assembly protein [Pseudomonas nicosulfuronedens]MDH2024969.1 PilX N-terminal domain-containing pilus assembly protein [Pseudomonas nicosulfuronedens]TLX80788.1 pilus assembly protein PilX [Pseudomonas nicosulfuronedens]